MCTAWKHDANMHIYPVQVVVLQVQDQLSVQWLGRLVLRLVVYAASILLHVPFEACVSGTACF